MTYMFTCLNNVTSFDSYEDYAIKARKIVEKYGGKFLIASYKAFDLTVIEGKKPDIVNLACFKNKEAFNSFYQSTEYQVLIKVRESFCESHIIMLEKSNEIK